MVSLLWPACLGHVEEAGEPAQAQDGEEGGRALQPSHRPAQSVVLPLPLLLPVPVLNPLGVPGPGVPSSSHGKPKNEAIHSDHNCHRPSKGPDKAMLRG